MGSPADRIVEAIEHLGDQLNDKLDEHKAAGERAVARVETRLAAQHRDLMDLTRLQMKLGGGLIALLLMGVLALAGVQVAGNLGEHRFEATPAAQVSEPTNSSVQGDSPAMVTSDSE